MFGNLLSFVQGRASGRVTTARAPIGRLCSTCALIFAPLVLTDDIAGAEFGDHHRSLVSLQASVDADCFICFRLWRHILRVKELATENKEKLQTETTYQDVGFYIQYRSRYNGIEHGFDLVFSIFAWGTTLRMDFLGLEQTFADDLMIPRSIPPRTASRRTIDQAKQWLADCLENHAGCRLSSKGDAKLPTRLIHVSKTRTGLAAHLCHSIDLPADTTYLSLSHCWGTTKFMTTTKANMQDMLISVPIANLSQSFQDAFYILAELGFQYIWIDSLCIVQDDLEDWERESKKMGDVYLSAICNLSASGFENGVHGFLPNLRISDPTPPVVHVDYPVEPLLGVSQSTKKQMVIVEGQPWREISTGPLSGRGWVLQEQVLASRTLHFGDEQLSWNCNATSVSETWPLGWRDERVLWHLNTNAHNLHKHRPIWQYSIDEFALMSKQSLYFVWQHLLNDYCSRAWTKASDRLPALAGIAAQIGRLLGDDDEYLFGLWSGDLMDSLIFFFPTEAPKDLIVLPDWNRAPSWSWASQNQPVLWNPGFPTVPSDGFISTVKEREVLASFDWEMVGKGEAFGLGVTGPLMRTVVRDSMEWEFDERLLQFHGGYRPPPGRTENGFSLQINLDPWFFYQQFPTLRQEALISADQRSASSSSSSWQARANASFGCLFFMPFYCECTGDNFWETVGLVLLPRFEQGKGVYVRVGSAIFPPPWREIDVRGHAKMYAGLLESECYQEAWEEEGNWAIKII